MLERPPPTQRTREQDASPLSGVGGSPFPIDPQLAADQATVFWQPEVLPTVVLLAPTPAGLPVAPPIDVARLGPDVAERLDEHSRHLIVRGRDEEFRLCVYTLERDQSLSVVIPFAGGFPVRAAAASRLWARMHASAPGQTPCSLTKQRRDRLILMLRALDGHLAAASYREIAEVLFGATRLEREPWKTSSLRDRTIRLVKGGLALMRDGYRKLLRGA